MKQERENLDTNNIVPLSSDEIKSILRSQSDSVFEDKNISNNSDFVKKSLIDIALDFNSNQKIQEEEAVNNQTPEKSKLLQEVDDVINDEQKIQEEAVNNQSPEKSKILQKGNDIINDEQKIEETKLDVSNENEIKKNDQFEIEETSNKEKIGRANEASLDKIEESIKSEKLVKDESLTNLEIDNPHQLPDTIPKDKSDELTSADNETQKALVSVRDAVSQSMNKNDDQSKQSLEDKTEYQDNVLETIDQDYNDFKNIFSSLSSLGEEAIYEVFKNKVLEISYELAGYQIDKIPEKFEEKIKSFLKNINCYDNKITIEVNNQDFEALSKIKNFNKNDDNKLFISNKELTRGDIILNCDGMRYSEKSDYRT